jgi:hypothetical protein
LPHGVLQLRNTLFLRFGYCCSNIFHIGLAQLTANVRYRHNEKQHDLCHKTRLNGPACRKSLIDKVLGMVLRAKQASFPVGIIAECVKFSDFA